MRHGVSLAMEPKLLIGALGSPYKSASASKGLPPPEAQNSYEYKKDGPGPVMVSDTLCPTVRILGT